MDTGRWILVESQESWCFGEQEGLLRGWGSSALRRLWLLSFYLIIRCSNDIGFKLKNWEFQIDQIWLQIQIFFLLIYPLLLYILILHFRNVLDF